jgi:hypothetical protein
MLAIEVVLDRLDKTPIKQHAVVATLKAKENFLLSIFNTSQ